jgi:hypothetical protein
VDILILLFIFLFLIFLLYINTGESNNIAHSEQHLNTASESLGQNAVFQNCKVMTNEEIVKYLETKQKEKPNNTPWNEENISKGISLMYSLHVSTNTNKDNVENNSKKCLITQANLIKKSSNTEIKGHEITCFNGAYVRFTKETKSLKLNKSILTALTINYFIKNNLNIPYLSDERAYQSKGSKGLVHIFLESQKASVSFVDNLVSRLLSQESLLNHVRELEKEDNKQHKAPLEI